MINEGSCDTEDWSNNAENSVLDHRNELCFKIFKQNPVILNCNYFTILLFFD